MYREKNHYPDHLLRTKEYKLLQTITRGIEVGRRSVGRKKEFVVKKCKRLDPHKSARTKSVVVTLRWKIETDVVYADFQVDFNGIPILSQEDNNHAQTF